MPAIPTLRICEQEICAFLGKIPIFPRLACHGAHIACANQQCLACSKHSTLLGFSCCSNTARWKAAWEEGVLWITVPGYSPPAHFVHSVWGPVNQIVLPTFRVALYTSVNPIKKNPHKQAHRSTCSSLETLFLCDSVWQRDN